MPEARVVIEGVAKAVEATLTAAARAGIGLGKPEIRPFGTWCIPQMEEGSPYWSTMWYVGQSLNESTNTIVGPRFIDTIRQEPWQQANAHYDVAILDYDLVDEPEVMASDEHSSYALSSTERDLAAVISVKKLREISDDDAFRRSLIRLTAHSFGHILEAPSTDRPQSTVRTFGDVHCSNTCVMRHAGLVEDLVDLSLEEFEAGVLYCDQCVQDILQHAIKNHFSLN